MMWTVFPGPWRVDGKGITYIRCTFNESLDLKPIIAKMNSKINYTVNSFFRFLTNRNVLSTLKLVY